MSRNLDGDNELIHTLYLQLYEKLFRVAYHCDGQFGERGGPWSSQTFLLALFQGEEALPGPPTCPEGWLMKALHSLAINERRRTARRQEIPLDTLFDQAAREASPPLAGRCRRLSPQDREVLLWRFEQGLDYDEIANLLGISPEVGGRSRVSRAVRLGSGRSGTEARGSLSQNKREISNFCTFPLWGQKKPSSGNAA
ncbi:MAG: RNA polymerase sigma factor [Oscillospiraceae bacterium]